MKRDELWGRLTQANPHWLGRGPDFTSHGFRQCFEQIWLVAHSEGFENGKASAEMEARRKRESGAGGLFSELFGG